MLDNENLNEVETNNVRYADRVAAKRAEMKPGFKKGFFVFYTFFAVWFLDFIDTFKRNKMKIAGYLIATPGIFIGFLLDYEIDSIYSLGVKKAAISMFILVLVGYINIFEAAQLIKNKNFGTCIIVAVLTAVIAVSGIIYITDIINVTNDYGYDLTDVNIKSFITVGVSVVLSIVGCVLAFIWRDKNYKKDKF